MPQRINDLFDVSYSILRNNNVFNGFVDIDSSFYIDPRLLKTTAAPELKNSYRKVERHFQNILEAIIRGESLEEVAQMLTFPEIPLVGLGYSGNHNKGKGIGSVLARNLAKTAVELVNIGVTDPVVFELAELFEAYIGADRISDMLAHILRHDFVEFSCRVASDINLPKAPCAEYICDEPFYGLPYSGHGVLFVPEDILTDLPLPTSFPASDPTENNNELREYVNRMFRHSWNHSPSWKELLKNKTVFREVILKKPEIMIALIDDYKSANPESYNFEKDPRRKFRWHDAIRNQVINYPLDIQLAGEESFQKKAEILCRGFCELVNKSLYPEFYLPSKSLVSEKIGQLIFWEFVCNYDVPIDYETKTGTVTLHEKNCAQKHQICFLCTTKGLLTRYKKVVEQVNSDAKVAGSSVILLKTGIFLEGKNEIDKIQRNLQRERKKVPEIFVADISRISSKRKQRKPQFSGRNGNLVGFS